MSTSGQTSKTTHADQAHRWRAQDQGQSKVETLGGRPRHGLPLQPPCLPCSNEICFQSLLMHGPHFRQEVISPSLVGQAAHQKPDEDASSNRMEQIRRSKKPALCASYEACPQKEQRCGLAACAPCFRIRTLIHGYRIWKQMLHHQLKTCGFFQGTWSYPECEKTPR